MVALFLKRVFFVHKNEVSYIDNFILSYCIIQLFSQICNLDVPGAVFTKLLRKKIFLKYGDFPQVSRFSPYL